MRKIASGQVVYLGLGLLHRHGPRIVDEQRENPHLVDPGLPELTRQIRIAPDLLGELPEHGQPDAGALHQADPLLLLIRPVRDPARVLALLQIGEDLGFRHGVIVCVLRGTLALRAGRLGYPVPVNGTVDVGRAVVQ